MALWSSLHACLLLESQIIPDSAEHMWNYADISSPVMMTLIHSHFVYLSEWTCYFFFYSEIFSHQLVILCCLLRRLSVLPARPDLKIFLGQEMIVFVCKMRLLRC